MDIRDRSNWTDIINSAIDFMPADKRKTAFYFAKIMEVLNYREDINAFEKSSVTRKEIRELFLEKVKPFITESERNNLDMIIKMIELKKIMG